MLFVPIAASVGLPLPHERHGSLRITDLYLYSGSLFLSRHGGRTRGRTSSYTCPPRKIGPLTTKPQNVAQNFHIRLRTSPCLYGHWFVPLRHVGGSVVGRDSPWKARCLGGDLFTGLHNIWEPRSFTGSWAMRSGLTGIVCHGSSAGSRVRPGLSVHSRTRRRVSGNSSFGP